MKIELQQKQVMISENKVYVIHENEEWIAPLREQFQLASIPFEEWFLDSGVVPINDIPPTGIFYNRISASSHTRNHHHAASLAEATLSWLESHDRRVVNNRNALSLEMRKTEQYIQLNQFGLRTPRTIAVAGEKQLLDTAQEFGTDFIVKPNRGGKGSGVSLFQSIPGLELFLQSNKIESVDGIVLLQDYIKPKENHIIRLEFIGGKFYYALKADTSEGFELCPADGCQVDEEFCPTIDSPKFEILEDFIIPEIPTLESFLKHNGIEIAAVEFVESEGGQRYFYDVNVNTNYNAEAEARNNNRLQGMREVARFLGEELHRIAQPADLLA